MKMHDINAVVTISVPVSWIGCHETLPSGTEIDPRTRFNCGVYTSREVSDGTVSVSAGAD